nr:hypothetical protein [Desulfobacterales bacterium]
MVSSLLGNLSFDADLENLITDKTEGNPFFIEEFIKSSMDLKIIERKADQYYLSKNIQGLSIPSSIQDVIMARVDTLAEDAKKVLQTGSVIEREFDFKLIKHVTGLSDKELLKHFLILKDSELIYERGIFPNSAFVFKHALTREVVY